MWGETRYFDSKGKIRQRVILKKALTLNAGRGAVAKW